MLEIKINKDPREYKDKLLFGLSVRQLLCTAIMLLINIPLYIWGSKILGESITGYLLILVAVPLVLIGFFEYNKMPFERVLLSMIQVKFIRPEKRYRYYSNENIVAALDKQILEQELRVKKEKKKRKFIKKK